MKKQYIIPALDIVEIQMNNGLLAGSETLPKGTETITEPSDILAPGLPDDFDL